MMIEDMNSADERQAAFEPPIQQQDILNEGELNSEEILARTILYALEEAAEKLRQSSGFDPFTILIKGEELYIEEHPGETEEESCTSARRSVSSMGLICDAYVFCYDGFVELDEGQNDALIVEYANKEDEQAQINIRLYQVSDDEYVFDESLYQVGEGQSYFDSNVPSYEQETEAEDETVEDMDDTIAKE